MFHKKYSLKRIKEISLKKSALQPKGAKRAYLSVKTAGIGTLLKKQVAGRQWACSLTSLWISKYEIYA